MNHAIKAIAHEIKIRRVAYFYSAAERRSRGLLWPSFAPALILNLLFHGELCGCDIQHVLGASQSNVSRHLSYLKNAGLVKDRRVGNRVYYSLAPKNDPGMDGLFSFLDAIFRHNSLLQKDQKKLLHAIKEGACSISEAPLKKASRKRVSSSELLAT